MVARPSINLDFSEINKAKTKQIEVIKWIHSNDLIRLISLNLFTFFLLRLST